MIEVKNICKNFKGNEVLKDISFQVEDNELLCISGVSGAGKTTLLNIVSCIEKATSGTLVIDGTKKPNAQQIQKIRREKIGYVFQNYGLVDNDSVQKNLELTSKFVKLSKTKRQQEIIQALEQVGLDETFLKRKIFSLSGGEQQRVALARLLITRPKYIFADEPTGNLDELNKEIVFELLEAFVKKRSTVVYVSHDPELIKRANRVIHLEKK